MFEIFGPIAGFIIGMALAAACIVIPNAIKDAYTHYRDAKANAKAKKWVLKRLEGANNVEQDQS